MAAFASADLDRREREFFSGVDRGKTFVFLLSESLQADGVNDLIGRVSEQVGVRVPPCPRCCRVASLVPEFRDFTDHFGTAYHELLYDPKDTQITPVCRDGHTTFGLAFLQRVFFLPCTKPDTHDKAVQMAAEAVKAVIAYCKRVSMEMPAWTAEFAFAQESALRAQATDLHCQAVQIEGQIDSYISFKGALAYQSTPLVEVVDRLLRQFFNVSLTIDDKCIEDATLQTDEGAIEAVFEIKGVKGNFTRANVNQVDSHRERLSLPANTPGVLVMNTLMGVDSLQEKDQAPHPDIIQKAVAERVLLIRTLDLLRYADGIEKGVFTKEAFRQALLCESGWLKVENDLAQVTKQ